MVTGDARCGKTAGTRRGVGESSAESPWGLPTGSRLWMTKGRECLLDLLTLSFSRNFQPAR